MSDKPRWLTSEELIEGNVVSWVNEPVVVDFVVDFVVKESATEIARRRWHTVEEGQADER